MSNLEALRNSRVFLTSDNDYFAWSKKFRGVEISRDDVFDDDLDEIIDEGDVSFGYAASDVQAFVCKHDDETQWVADVFKNGKSVASHLFDSRDEAEEIIAREYL